MQPDFASYNFEWLSAVPRWRDHYYATDQTPHYEYMKTVFKILQWIRGPKRWVMKCPQHLEQLPVLRTVFPDATVAITHRDPVAVIQSAVTIIAYGERMRHTRIDAAGIIAYWTDRVEHLLRACVQDRSVWPETQSIDVPFNRFMADEMAIVEQIYETAGLAITPLARTQIDNYVEQHPRGKDGQVVYHLERDFGVSAAALRERFQFYFDAFPELAL
jgi:sulfotransferase family protein